MNMLEKLMPIGSGAAAGLMMKGIAGYVPSLTPYAPVLSMGSVGYLTNNDALLTLAGYNLGLSVTAMAMAPTQSGGGGY